MRRFLAGLMGLSAAAAYAAPITPRITGHDFNFGGWETANVPFYDSRGGNPDWLTLNTDSTDREVTAYWDVWPVGGFPRAVFNAAGQFGGDISLALEFGGHDETNNPLTVSLIGSGRNAGADLVLSGAIPDLGIVYGPLLSIDISNASLYGYGGNSSFVLEGLGTIVQANALLPGGAALVGQQGAMRGNIDFLSMALPTGYDPLVRLTGQESDGGGYSGEAGLVPEPASLAALLTGAALVLRRRR